MNKKLGSSIGTALLLLSTCLFAQLHPEGWVGQNRQQLDRFINQYGKNSATYNPEHKPVAAFDWDNTVMKNDVGEATLLWMMAHQKLKRPANFAQMNPWLSKAALLELEKNCGGASAYLPTEKPACADTLLNVYSDNPLEQGARAWNASPDENRILPRYFFYAQLFAGYTPQQVRELTEQALQFNLKNPIGHTQKIGNKNYPAYVRIYEPMNNLIQELKANGFEVWIISASIQPSVEVVAQKVGIDKSHVIGVRQTLNAKGQLTDGFEACGPYADNNKEIISNNVGKRCWLNKIVFKLPADKQLNTPAALTFAAGDSEGDLVFLNDACARRLVINKNKPQVLCQALANKDGKWLINPMFIEPLDLNAC